MPHAPAEFGELSAAVTAFMRMAISFQLWCQVLQHHSKCVQLLYHTVLHDSCSLLLPAGTRQYGVAVLSAISVQCQSLWACTMMG